ncbi:phage tail assembly protein [Nocardia brasiliensis]|uniref:phage tail assembly protein n=1 Tax=Nocardia brasiliensis TaxID=37326 RepID=UPI0036701450
MANIFTLASLREEIENEFAPVAIPLADGTSVVLRNLLRLDKKDRDKVQVHLKSMKVEAEDDDADLEPVLTSMREVIKLAAETGGVKLLREIGDDELLLQRVFQRWMEATQPGEASNSPA